MVRLPIVAWHAASALGVGDDAQVDSMRSGRSGLSPLRAGLPFETWFGGIRDLHPPRLTGSLQAWDTAQARLAVATVDGAVAEAVAVARRRWGADRIGVAVGTTTGGIADTEQHFAELGAWSEPQRREWMTKRHNLHATAEVVALRLGLTGPAIAQSSACASSAKVMATAARWIRQDVCDVVVVGGVDTRCVYTLLGFSSLGILSPERCLPFSSSRRGINLGEAAAWMVIARGGDARGWLRGVGETSDAWHMTQPHPDGRGLTEAIRLALRAGAVESGAVELINAHATGTPANDPAEALALAACFPHRPPVVGTKGATGHALGACGALEAVLTLLCMEQGVVPGTLTESPLCY